MKQYELKTLIQEKYLTDYRNNVFFNKSMQTLLGNRNDKKEVSIEDCISIIHNLTTDTLYVQNRYLYNSKRMRDNMKDLESKPLVATGKVENYI